MLPQTLSSLGAPFIDQEPVEDTEAQLAADYYNQTVECVAQGTRSVVRAWVSFETDTGAPGAIAVVDSTNVWGDGALKEPAIEKTGTGIYQITYASTYDDALNVTETVSFRFSGGWLADDGGALACFVQVCRTAANVLRVHVMDSTGTPSDLSGGKLIEVIIR